MTDSSIRQKLEQVAQKIDPGNKLIRIESFEESYSAQVFALEIEQSDGQTIKRIFRRHRSRDLNANPNIAADEFKLLQRVHSSGIPAPQPVFLDTSCEIFPTPYLVVEYIEGELEFAPADQADALQQMAAMLAQIHQLDGDFSWLPNIAQREATRLANRPAPEELDESLEEGRIRDALETIWPPPQLNPTVLLHGDFWLGNLIWRAGKLVGVIDWEDAAVGDPLADVSKMRLEILWVLGQEAMGQFTAAYQAVRPDVDFTQLPDWDLRIALKPAHQIGAWAANPTMEQKMRIDHQWFVAQAFEQRG